jgi:membrane protein
MSRSGPPMPSSSRRLLLHTRKLWARACWFVDVVTNAVKRFVRHRGDTLGAALAFKTLLALAPLLVVAVAVLAHVVGEGAARTEALGAVHQAIGARGVEIVGGWLDVARETSTIATFVGTALFVAGASRLVDGIDVALEVIFDEPPAAEPETLAWRHQLWANVRDRAIHLAITLGLGLWIAGSLAARVALTSLWPKSWGWNLELAQLVLSFGSLVFALAAMYRVLPHRRLAWTDVLFGAIVTASLQTVGLWLLELWFTRAAVGAGYGATGAVVAILVFLYLSSQVFILGAELSAELLRRRWASALRTAL